jgi:uncharacterized protein
MIRIHPIIMLTVVSVIAAVCVLGVKFSANLYEMLPEDLPEVQGMDRLNRYFSRDGQLIVTVKSEDAATSAAAMVSLEKRLIEAPGLVSDSFRDLSLNEIVKEGGSLLAWLWLNAAPSDFAKLMDRLKSENSAGMLNEVISNLQDGFFDQDIMVSTYDPLGFSKIGDLVGRGDGSGPDAMISKDGTFQVMYVEGMGVDFSDYRSAAKWLKQVKLVVEDWQLEWDASHGEINPVTIGLTGTPAFMAEVGAEMEWDMTMSVISTMLLISLLFWIMHRKTRPLSWLIAAMLVILVITLLIGGLIFGDLSVMSVGFAAILMGLAVDYGIVLYREAMDSKGDARALRRNVGPGIIWGAATTAVVFLSLNLSSLPGLSEMGNLVAIGVAVGAAVMLYGFAPVAVSFTRDSVSVDRDYKLTGQGFTRSWSRILAIGVPVATLISLEVKGLPDLEANFHPFRIRESPSMIAWHDLQHELRGNDSPIPTVVTASSLAELHVQLAAFDGRVQKAKKDGLIKEAVLPTPFIPNPSNQAANAATLAAVLGQESRLLGEITAAGFSLEGAALTKEIFSSWSGLVGGVAEKGYAMPTGNLASWSVNRLYTEGQDGVFAALGTVLPTNSLDRDWVGAISSPHTASASLGSLGTALNERIHDDIMRVFVPMMVLLSMMLVFVFRNWRDLILSLYCLGFSFAAMILMTHWMGLSWNSFNICGLPLLFGTGLDFSIHMILALRRNGGNVAEARHGIGKALIFCGTSSAIGFGSLASASAYGLASLGLVCAVGILLNMITAIWLLPHWYRWLHFPKRIVVDKESFATDKKLSFR